MWRVMSVRTPLEEVGGEGKHETIDSEKRRDGGKKSECQRGTTARQSCSTRLVCGRQLLVEWNNMACGPLDCSSTEARQLHVVV